MILEVFDPRAPGVRTRLRLDTLPLSVGRGYHNDLILDDPYVDAAHARLALDETGALVIEDLGSTNGTEIGDASLRAGRASLRPGTTVRLGRTTLRIRDAAEPVPAALLAAASGEQGFGRWLPHTGAQLGVVALAAAVVALNSWLGTFERAAADSVFTLLLGAAMLVMLWAGIWAVAGRVVVQRFAFAGHLAVASLAIVAILGWTTLAEWAEFFFPDNLVSAFGEFAVGLAVTAALVAGHLRFASNRTRRQRWNAGFVVCGIFLAIGGLAMLVDEDAFTDIPTFSGTLKPVPAQWVPTTSVDDFVASIGELRDEVDGMVGEPDDGPAGEEHAE
jgi:hypothetical protein